MLYAKYFKKKFFSKMLLANILIVILSLSAVVIIVSENSAREIQERELSFNKEILLKVDAMLNQQVLVFKQLLQQYYFDSRTNPDFFSLLDDNNSQSGFEYASARKKLDDYFVSNLYKEPDTVSMLVHSTRNGSKFAYSKDRSFSETLFYEQLGPYLEEVESTQTCSAQLG